MTTSKAKRKAVSKPIAGLLNADLIPISTPQSSITPPYSDSGVGFEGYSKQQVSGGYKINPQSPFIFNYILIHPWLTGTSIIVFEKPGYSLFVTKISFAGGMNVAAEIRWYINTIQASIGSQYHDGNFIAGEVAMKATDFKIPLRFENSCYIFVTGASASGGEHLDFVISGYSEPL
jgi:hypothetical protein